MKIGQICAGLQVIRCTPHEVSPHTRKVVKCCSNRTLQRDKKQPPNPNLIGNPDAR